MAETLAVQQSRVFRSASTTPSAGTLPIPLTTVFSRWYGPIGPVKEVRDQSGDWDTAGQTRMVMLSPSGSFHEELTSLDPPHSFGYALTGITGPLGLLVGRAEGEWTFVPSGTATTITWSWNIHAASRLAAPFCRCWAGCGRATRASRWRRCRPS